MITRHLLGKGMETEKCSRCFGIDIVTEMSRGEMTCRGCGEVIVAKLMETCEWVVYSNDDRGRGESMVRASSQDSLWSSQSLYSGGTQLQRAQLQRAHLMVESKSTLKAARNSEEVYQIGSKLNLTSSIVVSLRDTVLIAHSVSCICLIFLNII